MTQLQFSFREILDEVDAMSKVAEPFIAPGSVNVLPDLREALRSFQSVATETGRTWGILETRPLLTQHSDGEYEAGRRKGSLRVYAEITSVWGIAQVREKIGKKARADRFALTGKTSTRVRIHSAADSAEIAMWRMEIGDSESPGCHFHVQVRGELDDIPFPKALSVPRLPSLHTSPLCVLEFVLSELFQRRWDERVAEEARHLERWAPIQRQRFSRILAWQIKTLRERAIGSPWVALKREKPEPDLFVKE